jgi:hypothetical protein
MADFLINALAERLRPLSRRRAVVTPAARRFLRVAARALATSMVIYMPAPAPVKREYYLYGEYYLYVLPSYALPQPTRHGTQAQSREVWR